MAVKTILIVDNEQYIQEIVQIALETVGDWQVITASSGREGLQKAEIEQPDAILLDVMMPGMDGTATFQQLQANPLTQGIPVLFLTAKIQGSDHDRYNALGVAATIPKPFDPLQLPQQISQALGWNFAA
ncbi:MAG: response regulator [Acaryochloridaceae cyanobacterium SU_2_1]|nr:response regulator [Acaryochloridaceae cyanobacterium SU_2_1]